MSFDGAVVEIGKKGVAAVIGKKRSQRIPAESIMKVHLRPATGLVNGFIQFVEVGDNVLGAGGFIEAMESARTENSVVFTRKQQPAFEKLRAYVEQSFRPGWTG